MATPQQQSMCHGVTPRAGWAVARGRQTFVSDLSELALEGRLGGAALLLPRGLLLLRLLVLLFLLFFLLLGVGLRLGLLVGLGVLPLVVRLRLVVALLFAVVGARDAGDVVFQLGELQRLGLHVLDRLVLRFDQARALALERRQPLGHLLLHRIQRRE